MATKIEDDDYINFLNTEKDFGDEFVDPIYKTFLEHLRVHGKSYVYEMENKENGLSTVVHYEAEDEDIGNNSSRVPNNMAAKTGLQNNGVFLESEPTLMEDSYRTFLRGLKLTGKSMIFEFDSTSIVYEHMDASAYSDALTAEEVNINNVTHEDIDDITVHENGHDYCSVESEECSEVTDFKSKLMIIQSKPYNQKEFDYLYDKAAERKLLKKQKHLRSYSKFYTTDEIGRSYFDYYPDFAKKFRDADRDMKLNLLRGFFFWIKNLCNEGSFKPWTSLGREMSMSGDSPINLVDD